MVSAKDWLKHFAFVVTCVLTAFVATAQTVDFTATPTAGCSPLLVSFTNTSTGFSNKATYNWDFGNGNTSALLNAGAQYQDAHDYTVTLTVTDAGKSYSKSTTITVYKKPAVDFSVDITKGCAPLPVNFTSNATPGDGTIASYFWDFGDGATALDSQHIKHTYLSGATVSPSLTVTNSYGCYSTLKKPDLIQVLPSAKPAFTASQTVLCTVNDPVSFINNTTGEGTLTYNWDFGDKTVSSLTSPQHQYHQKGTYDVTLHVTNSDGCTAYTTLPAYINVANFNTDFEVPPLLCEGSAIVFTNKSIPQPIDYSQQQWIIDKHRFAADSSSFSYSFTAGQHTVQLINNFGECKDTAAKSITVLPKPSTKGFVTDAQNLCGAPATVQFKDTTQGVIKWEWDVTNTTDTNFIPTAFTSSTNYTYTSNGTYYVWLRTTNAAGCTAEAVKQIDIEPVSASINSSAGIYGCDSLVTVFSATSTQVIKTMIWNFGDGTPTTTEAMPKHTFINAGEHQITLNFITANGCTGIAYFTVTVTPRPKFDYTAVPGTTICGNTPVSFTVTGSNLDGYYYWSFGDPTGNYIPGTSTTTHQYSYDTTYTVSLVISKEGCSDTVTKTNYITVLPPFPHIYNQANTCDGTRGLVTFQDASYKALQWSWDFGDSTPLYNYTTQQLNIQHTYSKTGKYEVKLTTKNGTCITTDTVITYVLLKQSPLLSSTISKVCTSGKLPVILSNLQTNFAALDDGVNHDFDIYNAQYSDSSLFEGSYTSPDETWRNKFHLNVTDFNNAKKDLRIITTSFYFNCLDTTNYIPLKVNGPKAGFEIKNENTCFSKPVTFSDTSKSGRDAAIVKWQWDFGDNNTAAKLNSNEYNYQYQTPGTYNVLLTVTDKSGCSDTAQHIIAANGIKAVFDLSENPVVPDSAVSFINQSIITDTANHNQFTWFFGDGTQLKNSSLDSFPVHSYSKTGVDTVMLIAKNVNSKCTDTAVQYLYVKNLNLNFTYTTEFINPGSGCPPMLAKFTSLSVNTTNISWNFGDGTTAGNSDFVSHIYNKPGRYKVTLYGYFLDNTVDSLFQYITIQGPYATLKTDKQFACGAQPITLIAKASRAVSYTWDFGDGTVADIADTFAVHNYRTPGMYTPSLIIKDTNNCSFPYFLDKPIIIDTLHLAIHTKPAVVCDSSIILFTPDIVSVAKDVVKVPLQYHWDFGTSNTKDTSDIEAPAFIFSQSKTYPVTLSAASPYGCVDETSVDIVVNPTPLATIKGPASLCQDDTGTFTGIADVHNNTLTWKWHFPNGNTSDDQQPAPQQFTKSLTDSIRLIINNNGCFDTAYHLLNVFARPVINIQPSIAQLCAGQSIQLEAHDGINYRWSPDKGINNTTIANPLASPENSTLYKVDVTNSEGCTSTDSVMLRVVQKFKVAAPPLIYICRGGTTQLNASGADLYTWIEGTDLSNANIANPVINTTTPQTYKVVGYDSSHCFTDTAFTEVRVAELPTVKAGADVTVFAGAPTMLTATASSDVTGWKWQPPTYLNCTNCPMPVSTPQANTMYIVQVNNTYGCTATDSIQVNVLCKQSLIQIPSAFTPNGDGLNERFSIKGNGIKLINRFAVFNRDGQLLFERSNMSADDANAGWDGTSGDKAMAPGTYVFIAEIVCATGEVYHYKGTVVLIR